MPAIRPISYRRLVNVLEREGFRFDRQKGDHLIYVRAGIKRPLVIPMYEEVPVFVIKNVLRVAGISRDRYFELLAQ